MRPYFIKTPWWLKKVYSGYRWNMPRGGKDINLTFDDGPHPTATPFVLDELNAAGAKATFFCIGKNVVQHPEIYQRIIEEGHAVGNHTQQHLNGWKTENLTYLADIKTASQHISSPLFRPPYGRITRFQAKEVQQILGPSSQIIMWDVLSADFDEKLSGEQCLENVVRYSKPGSIIVMHDSQKAWNRLHYALPRMIRYFGEKGFRLAPLT